MSNLDFAAFFVALFIVAVVLLGTGTVHNQYITEFGQTIQTFKHGLQGFGGNAQWVAQGHSVVGH